MVSRNLANRLLEISKLSAEELFKKANDQISCIINTEEVSEESCIKLVVYTMQVGATADGVLCAQEYEMAKAIFTYAFDSVDPDEFRRKLERPVDDVEIEIMREIVEKVSSTSVAGVRFAQAMCDLMMCIIAIDRKITKDEIEVLDEIFDEFIRTLGLMNIKDDI